MVLLPDFNYQEEQKENQAGTYLCKGQSDATGC